MTSFLALVAALAALGCTWSGGTHAARAGTGALPESISTTRQAAPVQDTTQDTTSTAVIGPQGGTIQIAGVASVTFPAGAFAKPVRIELVTTGTPQTEEGRTAWDVSIGPPSITAQRDMRIRFTQSLPQQPFTVRLSVPAVFLDRMPQGHLPRLFAYLSTGSAQESLDEYTPQAATFDPASRSVTARLTTAVIRDPDDEGTREVILLLASMPGR